MRRIFSWLGTAGRATVALVGITTLVAVADNYAVTLGSGTNFGSALISSVHYAKQLVCDFTAPATVCATVKAGNTLVAADVAVAVGDATLLAAVQAPIPPQSVAVPIGGHGICDGANGSTNPCTTVATVKAASTPAAATDKALVVDQRPGTTLPVNTAQVNGVTTLTGTGATGTGAQRVTVSTDQATNAGAALVKGGVGTVNGGSDYETVAASQTNQALGATGATGDYLSHCILQPTTTGAGTMTILDNAITVFTFTTGTLSNLSPIPIPIGAISVSGAWKVTTGANETVTCFGKFT